MGRDPGHVPHHPLTDWQLRQAHGIEWMCAWDRRARRRTWAIVVTTAVTAYASAATAAYAVLR